MFRPHVRKQQVRIFCTALNICLDLDAMNNVSTIAGTDACMELACCLSDTFLSISMQITAITMYLFSTPSTGNSLAVRISIEMRNGRLCTVTAWFEHIVQRVDTSTDKCWSCSCSSAGGTDVIFFLPDVQSIFFLLFPFFFSYEHTHSVCTSHINSSIVDTHHIFEHNP